MGRISERTATDELLAVAYEAQSVVRTVRRSHDPVTDPARYARELVREIKRLSARDALRRAFAASARPSP
jgi:hypothetical protein